MASLEKTSEPVENDINNKSINKNLPAIKILNQPMAAYKMRHKGDRKSSSCLYSEDRVSNHEQKYPKIEILNAIGPATLIISLVSQREPFHMHPHRLVGDKCNKLGLAIMQIGKDKTSFELSGLNIEYTKRDDVESRVNELKSQSVDPFNAGFEFDHNSVDLNNVRLCFQVYLHSDGAVNILDVVSGSNQQMKLSMSAVVSNVISNIIVKPRLQIVRAENMYSPVSGGKTVVIFLKKLEKDQRNLCAKFYDKTGWSKIVKISENLIHYRCSIMFNAPKYKQQDIKSNVGAFLKLFVPFANEKEKEEFLREKNNSSESLTGPNEGEEEEKDDNPPNRDAKYESKALIFLYTPNPNSGKQKLNLANFFSFVDKDSDAINEINQICRVKLAKRTIELLYGNQQSSKGNPIVRSDLIQNDSVSLNHIVKYTNDLNLISVNETELGNEENLLILNQIRTILDENYADSTSVLLETDDLEAKNSETQSSQQTSVDDTLKRLIVQNDDSEDRVYFDKLFNF